MHWEVVGKIMVIFFGLCALGGAIGFWHERYSPLKILHPGGTEDVRDV